MLLQGFGKEGPSRKEPRGLTWRVGHPAGAGLGLPPKRGKKRLAWVGMAKGEIVAMMMVLMCMVGGNDEGTGSESDQRDVCEGVFGRN